MRLQYNRQTFVTESYPGAKIMRRGGVGAHFEPEIAF